MNDYYILRKRIENEILEKSLIEDKVFIIREIIGSTLIISKTLNEEKFCYYKTNFRLIEFIEFIEKLCYTEFLILYDDFKTSNYIDKIYYPTDNKYVDMEFVIKILTPYINDNKFMKMGTFQLKTNNHIN